VSRLLDAVIATVAEPAAHALLHFLWQGSLVALGLALVLFLLRRRNAEARYRWSCWALALMVALPLVTAVRHAQRTPRDEARPATIVPVAADRTEATVLPGPDTSAPRDTGAAVRQLAEDWFELAAGEMRAAVHTTPSVFGDRAVVWSVGSEDGKAFVDGVCYHGPARPFDLEAVPRVQVGAALEVLRPGEVAVASAPVWGEADGERIELTWADAALALPVPLKAHPSG